MTVWRTARIARVLDILNIASLWTSCALRRGLRYLVSPLPAPTWLGSRGQKYSLYVMWPCVLRSYSHSFCCFDTVSSFCLSLSPCLVCAQPCPVPTPIWLGSSRVLIAMCTLRLHGLFDCFSSLQKEEIGSSLETQHSIQNTAGV